MPKIFFILGLRILHEILDAVRSCIQVAREHTDLVKFIFSLLQPMKKANKSHIKSLRQKKARPKYHQVVEATCPKYI